MILGGGKKAGEKRFSPPGGEAVLVVSNFANGLKWDKATGGGKTARR